MFSKHHKFIYLQLYLLFSGKKRLWIQKVMKVDCLFRNLLTYLQIHSTSIHHHHHFHFSNHISHYPTPSAIFLKKTCKWHCCKNNYIVKNTNNNMLNTNYKNFECWGWGRVQKLRYGNFPSFSVNFLENSHPGFWTPP